MQRRKPRTEAQFASRVSCVPDQKEARFPPVPDMRLANACDAGWRARRLSFRSRSWKSLPDVAGESAFGRIGCTVGRLNRCFHTAGTWPTRCGRLTRASAYDFPSLTFRGSLAASESFTPYP